MSLSPQEEASFIPIIDSILAASDLETISEKRIRKGLQAAVDHDIAPQKDAIKALIMVRFDNFTAKNAAATNGHTTTNGNASDSPETKSPLRSPGKKDAKSDLISPQYHTPPVSKKRPQEESEDLSDVKDSPAPKKKKKVNHDSDAAFAAKLQAQENSRMRATRGGGPRSAKVVKKKTPKKKTSAKVKAEDDSDIDGSGSEVKEKKPVNRNSGFHKELLLSAPLSALLDNEVKLSRPQTVKRIWEYVRAHDLQDQNDKRQILCDDAMRAVFKQEKVHMFTMNKILGQNLYNPDE